MTLSEDRYWDAVKEMEEDEEANLRDLLEVSGVHVEYCFYCGKEIDTLKVFYIFDDEFYHKNCIPKEYKNADG